MEYPKFRSYTELVLNKRRAHEQIDSLLEDEGPDEMYEYHDGPIFWPQDEGMQRMTFIYKLKQNL